MTGHLGDMPYDFVLNFSLYFVVVHCFFTPDILTVGYLESFDRASLERLGIPQLPQVALCLLADIAMRESCLL